MRVSEVLLVQGLLVLGVGVLLGLQLHLHSAGDVGLGESVEPSWLYKADEPLQWNFLWSMLGWVGGSFPSPSKDNETNVIIILPRWAPWQSPAAPYL